MKTDILWLTQNIHDYFNEWMNKIFHYILEPALESNPIDSRPAASNNLESGYVCLQSVHWNLLLFTL